MALLDYCFIALLVITSVIKKYHQH